MSYNHLSAPASKSLTVSTWNKVFSTNSAERVGWVCPVPISAGGNVYFLVVPAGTSSVTLTNYPLGSAKYQAVPPGTTVDDGARAGSDIYACPDVATTVYPSEVF